METPKLPEGFAVFKRETLFSTSETDRKCIKTTNHLQDIFGKYKGDSNLEITVTLTVCKEIFINELKIDYENVSYLMKYGLSECLCFYLQIWNGWRNSSATFEDLKSYITSKIKFLVEHQKKFCKPAKNVNDLEFLKRRNEQDCYVLTLEGEQSKINNKPAKPYIIEDDEIQPEWLPLNFLEFLHYPYVNVEINLPYIQIRRTSIMGYQRHGWSNDFNFDDLKPTGDPNQITSKKIDSLTYRKHKKKDILEFIVKFLKCTKDLRDKIDVCYQLGVVFEEFCLDLQKIGDEEMVEVPASMGCRYGEEFYVRNKRVVHKDNTGDPDPLYYKEVLVPQVILAILKFKPQSSLISTPKQRKRFVDQVNDSVVFSCLECSISFGKRDSFAKATEHFRIHHKPESTFTCSKCRKKIKIYDVLENRWKHDCINNKNV
ncbi:uncharacterized protein [Onthophagus taurus]|uniref:uncharacterized protein n=1 Tax=Onthophagus taurus TaxID=166361 RepID=UPI0039BE98CF